MVTGLVLPTPRKNEAFTPNPRTHVNRIRATDRAVNSYRISAGTSSKKGMQRQRNAAERWEGPSGAEAGVERTVGERLCARCAHTACHGVTLWSVWSAPPLPARACLPREGRSPCAHREHSVPLGQRLFVTPQLCSRKRQRRRWYVRSLFMMLWFCDCQVYQTHGRIP